MPEDIQLPEVSCLVICNKKPVLRFLAGPQELAFRIPQSLDMWSLAYERDDDFMTPLFDTERVVIFRRTERFPWRASDQMDIDANIFAYQPAIYHYVHLGPGWESRSVDLYWGLIRAAIALNREQNPMLAMVYESALAGSK